MKWQKIEVLTLSDETEVIAVAIGLCFITESGVYIKT